MRYLTSLLIKHLCMKIQLNMQLNRLLKAITQPYFVTVRLDQAKLIQLMAETIGTQEGLYLDQFNLFLSMFEKIKRNVK